MYMYNMYNIRIDVQCLALYIHVYDHCSNSNDCQRHRLGSSSLALHSIRCYYMTLHLCVLVPSSLLKALGHDISRRFVT